ncbi:MAG: Asp-tRNA(Asn)/Glu-tRNA(Gln) amidotransferase subunit GatC [Firmicutes bacterium]|nr:Asp-tRNA(Asn)/Glu-tRNA(Gln) amidotransferase subunit GatC [Bacillota bacterium]
MNISKKDVEQAAALSMLDLTEEEKTLYREQIDLILEYSRLFEELELEDVEPTINVWQLKNVLREDRAVSSDSAFLHNVLQEAPDQEEGYFLVPLIID